MKKIITIGLVANIIEWYDFSIYAFLATNLGYLFFNSQDPKTALLTSFSLFTISYVIRPIGALFWGRFGDVYGRKKALQWTLVIMSLPTFFIGCLPNSNHLGITSVILLIFLRLIQGFASGGEMPISACYISELSPKKEKNFFCSIVAVSPIIGVLFGSVVATLLYKIFSMIQINSYAWRFPFLFSLILFVVIAYIRKNIEETKDFIVIKNSSIKIKKLKNYIYTLFSIMGIYSFVQATFYIVFVWLPSYLEVFLLIDKQESIFSNTVGMCVLIISTLIVGYYAKKQHYKKFILISLISVGCLACPLFLLLQTKAFVAICMVQVVFAVCLSFVDSVIINVLTTSFDSIVRCKGVSIAFIIPSAVIGGCSPTLNSYLIYKTGFLMFPAFFITAISFLVMYFVYKSKLAILN